MLSFRQFRGKASHISYLLVPVCDVSMLAQREKLMETVKQTFDDKLDILVSLIDSLGSHANSF
jgi:hypothetical protein